MRPHPKRTSTNTRSPRAWGTCDRSGFITNHEKLVWQFDWRGTRLENLRVLVAPDMLDKPQRQLGTIILPPDPVGILNARPEQYPMEEQSVRMTMSGQVRYQMDGVTARVQSNVQETVILTSDKGPILVADDGTAILLRSYTGEKIPPPVPHVITGSDPMPSGFIGQWDFTAPSSNVVVNQVNAAVLPSKNIWQTQRRVPRITAQTNVTITANFGIGPDGQPWAHRVVGTGTFSAFWTLPSGVTTGAIVISMQSNTGSPQAVTFGGSPITVTSTWQSFLVASPGAFCLLQGTAGCDILVDCERTYTGGADLGIGPQQLVGHSYFPQDQSGIFSHEGVDLSALSGSPNIPNGEFTFQFAASPFVNNAFCLLNVMRRKASGGAAFQAIAADYNSGDNLFSAFLWDSSFNYNTSRIGGFANGTNPSQAWWWVDPSFQVRAWQYDGTSASVWIDGIQLSSRLVSASAPNVADFISSYFVGNIPNAIMRQQFLYNRPLTPQEHALAAAILTARSRTDGFAAGITRFVLAEGDSITVGFPTVNGGYPNLGGPNLSPTAYLINRAIVGATLTPYSGDNGNTLHGRQVFDNAMLPTIASPSRVSIYTSLTGINDYNLNTGPGGGYQGNPAQYAADLGTFATAQTAAGWRVVLCTLTPASGGLMQPGYNAWRNSVNAILRSAGWTASHGVAALADFAADPTMGPDAASGNVTLYSDGVHPTDAGQAILAPIWQAAVNSV